MIRTRYLKKNEILMKSGPYHPETKFTKKPPSFYEYNFGFDQYAGPLHIEKDVSGEVRYFSIKGRGFI